MNRSKVVAALNGERSSWGQDAVRTRILEAADRCFRELGPQRATLDDVATASGVSRRTIYNYFDGKKGLVAEIIVREARRAGQQATSHLDLDLSSADLLINAQLLLVEFSLESPYHALFARPDTISLAAEVFGHSDHFAEVQQEFWYPIFDIVAQRGELRPDFDRVAAVSWLSRINLIMTGPAALTTDRQTAVDLLRQFLVPAFVTGA